MKKKNLLIGSHRTRLFSNFAYWVIYGILLSLRLSTVVNLHPGYLHPDEFFQSVELATGDVYSSVNVLRTWEFRNCDRGPVRSYSSLWPLVHFPMLITKTLTSCSSENFTLVNKDFASCTLLPVRALTIILSFLPDFFIFWLSGKIGSTSDDGMADEQPCFALLIYSSMAYGGLVWGSRTLSNTWEMLFTCIFIFLSTQSSLCFLLLQASLSTWAFFLRPSFAIFILPFAVFQIAKLFYPRIRWTAVFLFLPLSLCVSLFTGFLLIYRDTIYFSSGDSQFTFSSLVITPLRFLSYNSETEKLAEHGLHSWFHYILIHWPLMLTPPLYVAAFWPRSLKFCFSLQFVCWFFLVFSTAVLSSIPHKESRFLLPCIPVAVVLGSRNLRLFFSNGKRRRWLLGFIWTWIVYQVILTFFWDVLHQGGLIPLLRFVAMNGHGNDAITDLNIFYRTYMPPRFLLNDRRNVSSVFSSCMNYSKYEISTPTVMDFGGRSETDFNELLSCIENKSTSAATIRLVIPGSSLPARLQDFGEIISVQKFFPHLSTEYPPMFNFVNCFSSQNFCNCLSDSLHFLQSQLSLHSYVIKLSVSR